MPDPALHLCHIGEESELEYELHYAHCGAAVVTCREHADGTLWADNDEYSSRVNFCPFCGFKARQPIVFGDP